MDCTEKCEAIGDVVPSTMAPPSATDGGFGVASTSSGIGSDGVNETSRESLNVLLAPIGVESFFKVDSQS